MAKKRKPPQVTQEIGSKELPGISLEKAVTRIQQMMDPDSVVTHNVKIPDRQGIKRQFDVVIRGKMGGRPLLGVIECKDNSRKKDISQIDGFAHKAESVNANLKMMVSRKGFTKDALNKAKDQGIGCLSLLPEDPKLVGFSIGNMFYARVYDWLYSYFTITYVPNGFTFDGFDVNSVLYKASPLMSACLKELLTTHCREKQLGEYELNFRFHEPTTVTVEGVACEALAMCLRAKRTCRNKQHWISWSGEALYDWHSSQFTIVPSGCITGSMFTTDFETWDECVGEIPDLSKGPVNGMLTFILESCREWTSDADAIDIKDLGKWELGLIENTSGGSGS